MLLLQFHRQQWEGKKWETKGFDRIGLLGNMVCDSSMKRLEVVTTCMIIYTQQYEYAGYCTCCKVPVVKHL